MTCCSLRRDVYLLSCQKCPFKSILTDKEGDIPNMVTASNALCVRRVISDIQLYAKTRFFGTLAAECISLSDREFIAPKMSPSHTVTTRPVTWQCSFPSTVIMDSDDYVETSDVDEQSLPSMIPHTPPRKRIKVRMHLSPILSLSPPLKLEHDSFIGPLQWNEPLQRDATLSSTPFSMKIEKRDVSPSAATFTPSLRVDHDEEMSVVPSTPQSSQDPLLLESQQREGSPALVSLPFRSLTISPRRPSPSSPRIISPRPFTSSPPITPTKSIHPTSDLDEGLFTPIADKVPVSSTPPVSILYRTSPFSPPSSHEKENQTPTLPSSSGPRDDVATNSIPPGPSDPLPSIVIPPQEQQQRVYSFRQRKAEQLHPYKADALRYKMTMKGVPEAIVNKGLPPGSHRRDLTNRYEDDDPAYDGELEEAEREHRRERRRQRALADAENTNQPAEDQAYLDGILPPLSDDEDVSALVKESRAIDRRRKQEERERKERERKEAEEIQRRHRTKRFPLRPEKTTDEEVGYSYFVGVSGLI